MTNAESKLLAIKKAWEDKWDLVENCVDEYGAIREFEYPDDKLFWYVKLGFKPNEMSCMASVTGDRYRPKALDNLETNNGWIRIEPDGSNLPTDVNISYKVGKMYSDGYFKLHEQPVNLHVLEIRFQLYAINEYKPITPEPGPIH